MAKRKILQVPKIKQFPSHCGPSSFCMVASYYGKNFNQEKIGKMMNLDYEEGIHRRDMIRVSRELGFTARGYHNLNLKDIISFINNDSPLIARILPFGNVGVFLGFAHFVVIKGYDDKNQVYFNDPLYGTGRKIDYETLEHIWTVDNFQNKRTRSETKNYGMLIKPL